MKYCNCCKQQKSTDEFYKNKNKPDGLTLYCKNCSKEKEKDYHRRNPLVKKFRNKKHILDSASNTRITYEIFSKMLKEQDEKCGICKNIMQSPYIDHDHVTGFTRMLLCHHCNTLLGMAKDNKIILEQAIAYLKKFEK